MKKRGSYHTEQQQNVLDYLKKHLRTYHTVQDVFENLNAEGKTIGYTTVYRTLRKLSDNGKVIKVFGINGQAARYKYKDTSNLALNGELYCKKCGAVTPLYCHEIDAFTRHLSTNHHFVLNAEKLVLYGYCKSCL